MTTNESLPLGSVIETSLFVLSQKNSDSDVALNTIFQEISHTMDGQITQLIDDAALHQKVKPSEDLRHAVTLYTTCEITRQALRKEGRPTTRLETERAKMFEGNRWQSILVILQKDWQTHLEQKASLSDTLGRFVRDTGMPH